jgi:hypothetical protein
VPSPVSSAIDFEASMIRSTAGPWSWAAAGAAPIASASTAAVATRRPNLAIDRSLSG